MMNSKTTIGGIFTVIGLIPLFITHLGLAVVPNWLTIVGSVCSSIAFIYTTYSAKDA